MILAIERRSEGLDHLSHHSDSLGVSFKLSSNAPERDAKMWRPCAGVFV